MVWVVFICVLVVVLMYILWQMEQVGKTNKSLKTKLQLREQELIRLQQAVYQLAEQQKLALEKQLMQVPAASLLTAHEMQLARLLSVSLPVVVKECCDKAAAPQQVVLNQLRRHSTITLSQLEQMMKKHPRLTPLWRGNSIITHIQLCAAVADLATEETPNKVSSL